MFAQRPWPAGEARPGESAGQDGGEQEEAEDMTLRWANRMRNHLLVFAVAFVYTTNWL